MQAAKVSGHARPGRGLLTITALALASLAALATAPGQATAAPRPGSGTAAQTISTVAGGAGGPGKATKVSLMACGVYDNGGSLYVADGPAVRKITANDQLTTPAGTGVATGPLDNGGPATGANLHTCGVATDHHGNLVIAMDNYLQIGVVAATTGTFYGQPMTAGHIYTVAGNGKRGFAQSGLRATRAPLYDPGDVAVDAHGNLVITDSGKGPPITHLARLQVVAASTGRFYGRAMKAGHIYTVAGGGANPANGVPATQAVLGRNLGSVTLDRAGNLVLAAASAGLIQVVAVKTGTFYGRAMTAGDIYAVAGTGTAQASLVPTGVAVDAAGNLVIADATHRVRVLAVTSGRFYGRQMTAGHLYTVAGTGKGGFAGDGGPATAAKIQNPRGAVPDGAGNLVIADWGNGVVRVVAEHTGTFYGQAMTAGDIYTVGGLPGNGGVDQYSGDGGPATKAEFSDVGGVAVDPGGNTVVADQINSRIRVVAASTGVFYGQAMTAGDVYTVAGNGTYGFSGDGGLATKAELFFPIDAAADHAGNLVIADTYNNRIRVVAGSTGTFYGQAMTTRHIYTVAGSQKAGFSGDGGPATSAELNSPQFVAVDPAGNLVISDGSNNRVRVVAAKTGAFYGRAMTAGDIYTVAGNGKAGFNGDGGPATSAELDSPEGIAIDSTGNALIDDLFNNRVRVVADSTGTFYGQAMTAGHIYTMAGNGTAGFAGDGGPATGAELHWPLGAALDGAGNVVIADANNNRVRVVAGSTGTFYGQAMTAGHIYTVAGNGTAGFAGDGGPATGAQLDFPGGIAAAGHGGLLIADNRRVRMVAG